jgi:hypothetical protein
MSNSVLMRYPAEYSAKSDGDTKKETKGQVTRTRQWRMGQMPNAECQPDADE